MLLSNTLQQPTQRLHVSMQLLALIKEAEEGVFCSSEEQLCCFATVTDANISLTLVEAICRFTQYLSVCGTVCDSCVYSADCTRDTRTQTHTRTHARIFGISTVSIFISVFMRCEASQEALIRQLTKARTAS